MSPVKRQTLWWVAVVVVLVNVALFTSVQVDKAYIHRVAGEIIPFGSPDRDVVKAVTKYVRDDIYHPTIDEVRQFPWYVRWNYLYNRFRPGPATIMVYGTHHLAPCQSNSRVFNALLAEHGIKSRTVIQHDDDLVGIHSVVEVDYAGTSGICGPSYGIIYQHEDGRPATLKELRDDDDLFERNAQTGYAYGWGPDSKSDVRKLPQDLYHFRHAMYFNYKWFGPFRYAVFNAMRLLGGEDGPYLLKHPKWYRYPAYIFAVIGDFGLAALIALWLLVQNFRKRGRGRSDRGREPSPRGDPAPVHVHA